MIDNALTLEGLFSIVLFGKVIKMMMVNLSMVLTHKTMERTHSKSPKVCLKETSSQTTCNLVKDCIQKYEE